MFVGTTGSATIKMWSIGHICNIYHVVSCREVHFVIVLYFPEAE
jgi:hypothetical protein